MPTPQPAPADTGTPRQAPLPPSVRRPLPANVPRTPRPIAGRRALPWLAAILIGLALGSVHRLDPDPEGLQATADDRADALHDARVARATDAVEADLRARKARQ